MPSKNLGNKNFVKGLRVANTSLKIYECSNKNYLVVRRRYFMGIPISSECMVMDNYEGAEDLIRELKYDGRCGK
jgi:hypothetical protein